MCGFRERMRISAPSRPSGSPLDHQLLDSRDGLAWVQALRARPGAIENGVAPIQAKRIFEIVEPFPGRLIAAVHQPTPSLKQYRGAEESIRVPPMTRAARRAAEAQNAFPEPSSLATLLGRLEPFRFGRRRLRLQPRLNDAVLREYMRQVGNEVLDDPHVVQRVDRSALAACRTRISCTRASSYHRCSSHRSRTRPRDTSGGR